MEDNSAAARIARFRQGKPMSREEREKLNQSSGVKKMWYESDNGGGDDQQEVPRSLNVGPSRQPARPNSALRAIRQPTDYMSPVSSNSLFQNTKLGESQNVDDMIQNSIRQLERDMYEFDRKTNAKMNLGSFDPTRSIDLKRSFDDSPNFRFGGSNMRDSKEFDTQRSRSASPSLMRRSQQNNNRLSDSTGDFLRKYDIGNYSDAPRAGTAAGRNYTGNISPLRLSGDILRSSVETLGSTGFMGLMKANLKLDGKKEEQEKPKEEKSDAQIAEINKTLEEFLSGMREQHPPRNPYFPEGVDETISQITNKLHSQIMEFKTLFGDKHLQEDAEISAQQERDEKMREEGRNQLRERQLLELDLPASHPLEFMGVWDGQQQQPVMPHQGKLDYFPYPVPHQAGGTHVGAGGGNAGIAGGTQHTPAKVGGGGAAAGEEDDMSHLRLSDNSVGSPFPHYDSTILSPEPGAPTTGRGGAGDGSGDAPSTVEGFPVGNKDSSAGGEGHSTGDKKTTGAGADGSAADGSAAPTLLNAGLLSQHAAAHMSVLSRPVAGAGAGGVHPVGGRNFAQGVGMSAFFV